MTRRSPGPEERALIGLTASEPLPPGGRVVVGVFRAAAGAAGAVREPIGRHLGVTLSDTVLVLRVGGPLEFLTPRAVRIGVEDWLLDPVILGECAIGVAVRRREMHDPTLLEVVSPVPLAPAVRLVNEGDVTTARLLDGRFLRGSA